ncbi:MAG: TIM barrel protein [Clostridiales bacterium]|nr:TIM barrel protein [Clostridiales bacterium]
MSPDKERVRFGPAGNSDSFYAAGFSQTVDAFLWQREQFDLDAFEVPFGRGISMSAATAEAIGAAAHQAGVTLSAHAPYYINLANPSDEMAQKSMQYILSAARLLDIMGGSRLVVHVGSPKKESRETAMALSKERLTQTREQLIQKGFEHIRLCLETMGRPSVIGTLDEVLSLVAVDDSFLPCIDFAHLHASGGGAINDAEDFKTVLDAVESSLDLNRARQMHMHFSRIEFGKKGEIRHRVFAETDYGPEPAWLMPLLAQRGYHGVMICESRGNQAEDAAQMQRMYLSYLKA